MGSPDSPFDYVVALQRDVWRVTMKWIVRFTVRGPDKQNAVGLLEMLALLDAVGKRKHCSYQGWEPRRGG
jgi:hypothetical protein